MLKLLFFTAIVVGLESIFPVSIYVLATTATATSSNGQAIAVATAGTGQPYCSRPYERWVKCTTDCLPKKCSELGFPVPCPTLAPDQSCASGPGCICIPGYVRDYRGYCVPKSYCPSCGGDANATSGCGNCPKTCQNYNSTKPEYCPQFCKTNGCDCKPGFVLDTYTNMCILPGQCKKCKPNEHYTNCPDDCTPKKCSELGFPIACPGLTADGSCPSKPGCVCNNGYVKADNGTCIPIKECPSCGGDKNAQNGCGNCPKTCKNINNTEPQICPQYCDINGCDCKPGFYLDETIKKCVRPEQCNRCGLNEHIESCPDPCEPRKCSQLGFPITCPGITEGSCPTKPACVCNDGYKKNEKGICIPTEKCPSCRGDENAESGCGSCQRTCRNYISTKPPICNRLCIHNGCKCKKGYVFDENKNKCVTPENCTPTCGPDEYFDTCVNGGCHDGRTCEDKINFNGSIICVDPIECEPGCLCKKGLLRNKEGICVPKDECPNTPTCGPDEFLDECAIGGCHDARTCEDLDILNGTYTCDDSVTCKPGCLCKDGLLKNRHGKCVPENKCPNSKCKGDYETYVQCDINCLPERCDQLGFPIICPIPPPDSSCPGKPACICKNGYVRDKTGKCIPRDQCPSCKGDPNAKSGCGTNCGRHCSDYGKGPVACALSCILNGCDCKDGYYYDDNIKKCVLLENCTPVCGQNEKYTPCVEGGCVGARNCSQISYGQTVPVICRKLNPSSCTAGCICIEGHLRNKNGICVPKEECSLNDKCTGKPYEFYDPCPSTCLLETCASIGKPYYCPPQNPVCKPRCRCADGYKRNYKGVCVPEKQCNQCGKNEIFDKCVLPCPPRTCGINDAAVLCAVTNPADCKAGCRCADGFYRNNVGECVAFEDCPHQCGKNEVYDKCVTSCPPRYCGMSDKVLCGPTNPADCKVGCRCADGFYKNDKGECVAWKDCPQCPKYEVYDPCPDPCPRQVCSVDETTIKCAAPPNLGDPGCKPGCRCEYGYKRNHDGKCIPKDKCPQICNGANEYFEPCPSTCDFAYCDNIGKDLYCPLQSTGCGKGACRCKPGYLRNKVGECVTIENCLRCRKPHEYYSCGSACDNVCATLSKQNQTNCPIINIKCNEMCYCEKGYARDSKGNCIPISSCPKKCTGPHEYYACGSACDNVCATLSKQNQTHCPIINVRCNDKCYCQKGYARDSNGICIPIANCPKKCTGPHEYYACGGACDNVCATLSKQNQTHCPIINVRCNDMCYCQKGYARDSNGICIPIANCPKSPCPKGQVLGCGNNCNRKCFNYRYGPNPYACPRIACAGSSLTCQCDPLQGYYYDDDKQQCVYKTECP